MRKPEVKHSRTCATFSHSIPATIAQLLKSVKAGWQQGMMGDDDNCFPSAVLYVELKLDTSVIHLQGNFAKAWNDHVMLFVTAAPGIFLRFCCDRDEVWNWFGLFWPVEVLGFLFALHSLFGNSSEDKKKKKMQLWIKISKSICAKQVWDLIKWFGTGLRAPSVSLFLTSLTASSQYPSIAFCLAKKNNNSEIKISLRQASGLRKQPYYDSAEECTWHTLSHIQSQESIRS